MNGTNGEIIIFNLTEYLAIIIQNTTETVLERLSNEGVLNISEINSLVVNSVSFVGKHLNSTYLTTNYVDALDYTGNTFNRCVRGWC